MDFKITPPVEQNVTITMTNWEAELLWVIVGSHSPASLGRLLHGSSHVQNQNRLRVWLADLYGGLGNLLYPSPGMTSGTSSLPTDSSTHS